MQRGGLALRQPLRQRHIDDARAGAVAGKVERIVEHRETETLVVGWNRLRGRDTDVAVEALRISDYLRPLAALRLRASIVVLDLARPNPFARTGPPLAGGLALVVNFDPADAMALEAFRTKYGITNAEVQIFGPFSGKLGNRSDRVALEKRQYPDLPGDPYSWIIVDEVIYGNQSPWPASANGAPR